MIETNIVRGLAVIIILNTLIAGASYYTIRQSQELRDWESHTQEVLINLEETLSSFSEMHAVFRGYVLFNEPGLLTSFFESKKNLLKKIQELETLTLDNPRQQEQLRIISPLVFEKTSSFETLIMDKKHRSVASYIGPFRSTQGIILTRKIQSLFSEMKKEEIRLLTIRKADSERNLFVAAILIFLGILLNLTFIILQYILIYKESQRRQIAEEEVELSNKNLKEYSGQLERSNKDLESFSYSVSHDLRAPIRGISGFSKILMEDFGKNLDEEGQRILNIIIKNSENMGQLIDDLLEFSRLGRREIAFTNVNMQQVMERVLEEVKDCYPGIKIETRIGELPSIKADSALLKQMLFNLISNAFKYSKDKEHPKVDIDSYQNNGEVTYFIKDNGAGFDMRYQHKLFNIFQRLHHSEQFEGTGVGLAIVKRVIEKHNGKVWAEGKVNEGACFYFTLGVQENNA